jgi:hypothetical protein
MATQVYTTEDITLQDGTDVTLKPLAIARLRRFMNAWREFEKLGETDDNEDGGFDVFVNCAGVGLSENFADKFDDLWPTTEQKKKGLHLNPDYKAYLEDVLDLDSIYKVLEIAGGIKLNDPKLMEAALLAAAETESAE